MARQVRKKRSLLVKSETYEEIIQPGRSARTHKEFTKMAAVVTENWIASSESVYAEWFKDVYLTERWSRWHNNGAGITVVIPSQQGIDSHHSVIKKTCVPSSRASTTGVLKGIIPRIRERLCPDSTARFCEEPVHPEMIAKAVMLLATERNYKLVHKGWGRHWRLVAIVMNGSKYIEGGGGLLEAEVNDERAETFIHSLNERLPRRI